MRTPISLASLAAAASWADRLMRDPERRARLGEESRAVAEREFALKSCADEFEEILTAAVS